MATARQIPDWPRGITFEQVWAGLMENREQQKETDRIVKEIAKRQKETDRQMKETSERMGFLNNRFGELAEHLVAPGIAERFNELGYHFDGIAEGGYKIKDAQGKLITEVDILLENGDCIMAVEVKSKPKAKDIEHHIKRLEILREHRRKKNDARAIYGAIAGAVWAMGEKKATIDAGFYVLEQSGDTMKMAVPENFVPKEW